MIYSKFSYFLGTQNRIKHLNSTLKRLKNEGSGPPYALLQNCALGKAKDLQQASAARQREQLVEVGLASNID
jgi:hypothetical protein